MKWREWLKYLKFLIAFLIPMMGVMVCNNGLDNDSWYVLAEGREIVENGVYYEDQLSMHEGLDVTVQNYGFAAIFYLLYSAFGGVGIYLIMLILNGVLMFLIYKICMLLSNKNINLSLLIMILTDLLLAYGYIVTRAQVVSYVILMLLIYILELYVRKGNKKALWWIPVLSLLQINLHASLWPMILIVIGVYMIDGVRQPRFKYKGYKIKPLVLVGVASFVMGFLNPYGVKMMTFLLTSYGVPEANNYIEEMKTFNVFGANFNILLYVVIVSAMILYIFGKNRNIRLRYLILIFGFLALGLSTVKGMSQLILVLLFPLAEVYKDAKIGRKKSRKLKWMVLSWAGILAFATIMTYSVVMLPRVNCDGPFEEMVKAVDVLDEKVGDANKNDLKVYADYNEGGYLEFRGYRPYIDPRMEVFLLSNNGKADIFLEFYDLQRGVMERAEFLEKYNFDYLVLNEYDVLYNFVSGDEYELVFEDDNEGEYDGVKVYQKIKNVV